MGLTEDGYVDVATEASGRKLFSEECKSVLGRFIVGERPHDVLDHVRHCCVCGALVFGDGRAVETSLFDDLERARLVLKLKVKNPAHVPASEEVMSHALGETIRELQITANAARIVVTKTSIAAAPVTEPMTPSVMRATRIVDIDEPSTKTIDADRTPKAARRRFLKFATIAAAVVVTGGVAPLAFRTVDGSGTQKSSNTGLVSGAGRSANYSHWDAAFRGNNYTLVRAMMGRADADGLTVAFDWIAERRITALYPDVVAFLANPNVAYRRSAVGSLFLLPPIQLKPQLAAIQSARTAETDVPLQYALDTLIVVVSKA